MNGEELPDSYRYSRPVEFEKTSRSNSRLYENYQSIYRNLPKIPQFTLFKLIYIFFQTHRKMATCKQLISENKHVRDLDRLCSKILHRHLNQRESQSPDHMNPPLKVHAQLLKRINHVLGPASPQYTMCPRPFLWWRWQAAHIWCNSSTYHQGPVFLFFVDIKVGVNVTFEYMCCVCMCM